MAKYTRRWVPISLDCFWDGSSDFYLLENKGFSMETTNSLTFCRGVNSKQVLGLRHLLASRQSMCQRSGGLPPSRAGSCSGPARLGLIFLENASGGLVSHLSTPPGLRRGRGGGALPGRLVRMGTREVLCRTRGVPGQPMLGVANYFDHTQYCGWTKSCT